jgi:hypothetical protein
MDLQDLLGDRFLPTKRAARAGTYQLLLGAGASLGAVNATGARIPAASGLVAALQRAYPTAQIDSDTPLQRAYQRAVLASSRDTVWRLMKKVFSGAKHEPWFRTMAGLPWRRVWTLNIDDTFENSYVGTTRSRLSRLRSINWVDEYAEWSGLEVVHLHGTVVGAEPSPLIFSLSEYQSSAEKQGVWQKVLRGLLTAEPFAIIGAKLLGDQDVEALVLASRPSHEAPSFIVDPFIEDGNKWELEQAGFVVIRETAESWIEAWVRAFALDTENLESIFVSEGANLPQMIELRADRVIPATRSHDFLGGSEPRWSDACEGRIARFEWMNALSNEIKEWGGANPSGVFVRLLYAERLVGVTAGLLQVARQALQSSFVVLEFDRSTRFMPDQVLDFCRSRGSVLLLIDGVHEFAADVDRLAEAAKGDPGVSLFVLVVDRPSRDLKIEDKLRGSYPKRASKVVLRRSKTDAKAAVGLLHKFGRLGRLESKPYAERVQHFAQRDIFSTMSEVEHSAAFKSRLDHEVVSLSKAWHRDLLFLLALASVDNYQVGLTEAAFAVDVSTQTIDDDVARDSHLSALIEQDGELLFPRQRERGLASLVSVGRHYEFLMRLSNMLINLAPLATSESLMNRNRAAVLTGRLMNAKQLRSVFPDGDLPRFYESLREHFGDWNARYWEQRAIDAKGRRDWGPAESFAERAVSLKDDGFTRTTLGTILLNKSENLASEGDAAWIGYYERGFHELEQAMGMEIQNRVSAFAYLEAVLVLLSVLNDRAHRGLKIFGSIEPVIRDWQAVYAVMRVGLTIEDGFESTERAEALSIRFGRLGLGGEIRVDSPVSDAASIPAIRLPVSDSRLTRDAASSFEDMSKSLSQLLDEVTRPTPYTVFSDRLNSDFGPPSVHKWGGTGSFAKLLKRARPDAMLYEYGPGYVLPPQHGKDHWRELFDHQIVISAPPSLIAQIKKSNPSVPSKDSLRMSWVVDAAYDFAQAGGLPLLHRSPPPNNARMLEYASDALKLTEARGRVVDLKDALFALQSLREAATVTDISRSEIVDALKMKIMQKAGTSLISYDESEVLAAMDEWLGR